MWDNHSATSGWNEHSLVWRACITSLHIEGKNLASKVDLKEKNIFPEKFIHYLKENNKTW